MAAKLHSNLGLSSAMILLICSITYLTFCVRACTGIMKDPRSQFHRHAVVQPSVYNRHKRDLGTVKVHNEETLTIGFVAFDQNFVLDLRLNEHLMPPHYFEKHHENGSHVTRLPMKNDPTHCHYQGHLRGMNHSWAAISTCNGVSGVIYDGNQMHYIHPNQESKESNHFLFRASDLKVHNLTCGYNGKNENIPLRSHVLDVLQRNRRSAVLQDPYKSNAQSRYLELIIVNDNKEFKEFNQDKDVVFQRSKEIANIVNGLYSPLNIFISLVGVIVWSDHDEIKLSPDGDATLTNFLLYRRERLAQEHPNDNAQLITAMTLDNGVVGKALKGPICTYMFSGGVNMDHSHVVGLVANTVSHEIGHNLGLEHDSDECQCPDEKCIMAPSSSSTSPKHWSSCSFEYLDLAYSQGMDYCLKNRPTDVIGPVCGNGFLEQGEECDCGLKEFCDNKCCNASSCLLFDNATCAVGGCCNMETCQVKEIATLCRESVSECDLPEYCDGISEFCPHPDTFLQNGEECGNGKAYCFDGQCRSHEDQCKLLWGQTGKMSDVLCYEQNYKGNVNGNCGFNRVNETYKACRKEDVKCGMLHCTHLNEKLEFGMESAAILARSYIPAKGKMFTCRSAMIDLGLYNTDPGLVPNGAKCATGKACLNQRCVPLSSLKGAECPYHCSGNGVCNNRGNCHCDRGYGPPFCDTPGPGGSIDSGPASDPTRYFVMVAMYVIFLGLVPLVVLSAAAVYYYRSHLKAWWSKKAHKANIKSRTNTTTQRKAPSKFNFDRNSLRTLEISGPIQIPPPATGQPPSQHHAPLLAPLHSEDSRLAKISQCQAQISHPVVPSGGQYVPSRPAPPRPPCDTLPRTIVSRSPSEAGNRPLSAAFRPNCPPPRPPPPKSPQPYLYEDVPRSSTPSYYDDCQTLDFSDTSLAFVHKPASGEGGGRKAPCNGSTKAAPSIARKQQQENEVFHEGHLLRSANAASRTNSVVASLAQKFEKQESAKANSPLGQPQGSFGKKNSVNAAAQVRPQNSFRTTNASQGHLQNNTKAKQPVVLDRTKNSMATSLAPPFKSRPLPPRPEDPHV